MTTGSCDDDHDEKENRMKATITSIPMISKKPHVGESLTCLRCGGFLVEERCMDIGESLGGYWFWASRCIQCGDIVDEVILRNRYNPHDALQTAGRAA
jgi:hypothetical protein